jgi:hypothetical protein
MRQIIGRREPEIYLGRKMRGCVGIEIDAVFLRRFYVVDEFPIATRQVEHGRLRRHVLLKKFVAQYLPDPLPLLEAGVRKSRLIYA